MVRRPPKNTIKPEAALRHGRHLFTDARYPGRIRCSGGDAPVYLEIDKLPDGRYRATVGTLFEHQEICRTRDLEALIRQANAMAGCQSFDSGVDAFRAMRTLG